MPIFVPYGAPFTDKDGHTAPLGGTVTIAAARGTFGPLISMRVPTFTCETRAPTKAFYLGLTGPEFEIRGVCESRESCIRNLAMRVLQRFFEHHLECGQLLRHRLVAHIHKAFANHIEKSVLALKLAIPSLSHSCKVGLLCDAAFFGGVDESTKRLPERGWLQKLFGDCV